jgi:hypothetical protein
VVTHKALAHVSLDAAKHCGIPEAQVYTMADAPAHEHELALPSIECVYVGHICEIVFLETTNMDVCVCVGS